MQTFVRYETGEKESSATCVLGDTLVGLDIDWTMLEGDWVGTTRMPWGEVSVTDEYRDRAVLRLLAIRIGVRDLTSEDRREP